MTSYSRAFKSSVAGLALLASAIPAQAEQSLLGRMLFGEDEAPRISVKREPRRDYNRAANPQVWHRLSVPLPAEVTYSGPHKPGSIVIDHKNQYLYVVQPGGRAIEYVVAVGRSGREVTGRDHYIARAEVDPTWFPEPGDTRPNPFAKGGPTSPLGVRGMFLASNAKGEQGFTIHGTNAPIKLTLPSGQRKVSDGCIRMLNEDVMDVFDQVRAGTPVHFYYKGEVAAQVRHTGATASMGAPRP